MSNTTERIEKIKEERIKLYELLKESITNNKDILNDDIKEISNIIKIDDDNLKKYENILKVRLLVDDLSKRIIESKNTDEITELRSDLSKAINKVKREIKKRNIENNKYTSDITNLRKDITKYLRIVKREENLIKIKNLNDRIEDLSSDDLKELKRLIKNEQSYNNRNKKKEESIKVNISSNEEDAFVYEPIVEPNEKKTSSTDAVFDYEPLIEPKEKRKTNGTEAIIDYKPLYDTEDGEENKLIFEYDKKYNNDYEFVSSRVDEYKQSYRIIGTHEYNKGFLLNSFNFIRNIPIYFENKSRIKDLENASYYYSGGDFIGFIEYERENNSYINGLKSIINRSSLYRKDNKFMSKHERCINWIMNFLDKYSIELNYNKVRV